MGHAIVTSSVPATRVDARIRAFYTSQSVMHQYKMERVEREVEEARIRARRNFWRSKRGRAVKGTLLFSMGIALGVGLSQSGSVERHLEEARLGLINLLSKAGEHSTDGQIARASVSAEQATTELPTNVPQVTDDVQGRTISEENPTPVVGAALLPATISEMVSPGPVPKLPAVRLKAEGEDAQPAMPTKDQVRQAEEPAIDKSLLLAIDSARQRRAQSPELYTSSPLKPRDTGVHVTLPSRGRAFNAAPTAAHEPPTAKPGAETGDFAVVKYLEGSLLVRTGKNVKTVRVGETLPNGKKLTAVNAKGQKYEAE